MNFTETIIVQLLPIVSSVFTEEKHITTQVNHFILANFPRPWRRQSSPFFFEMKALFSAWFLPSSSLTIPGIPGEVGFDESGPAAGKAD